MICVLILLVGSILFFLTKKLNKERSEEVVENYSYIKDEDEYEDEYEDETFEYYGFSSKYPKHHCKACKKCVVHPDNSKKKNVYSYYKARVR